MYMIVFTNAKSVELPLYSLLSDHNLIGSGMLSVFLSTMQFQPDWQPAVPFSTHLEAEAVAKEAGLQGIASKILPCSPAEQEYWLVRLQGWDGLLKQRLAAKGIVLPTGIYLYEPERIRSLASSFAWDATARIRMAALLLIEDKPAEALIECSAALQVADEYERVTGRIGQRDEEKRIARYLIEHISKTSE